MARKLYRSRTKKMIAGVCGGLGEFLGIDPTIIRLLWALTVFVAGTGILLYLLAWVVVPEESY